ncbi:hypothetical protein Droror1_Dr00017959 [Drosera rotundifolia]
MFYSHQLLARKAPLGQIWFAATTHGKMNRKKLNQIDIIKICEEILNPSVPMALRLSGILMGGVVIVYERKVKLLYDDVSRLLVELNESWKVKKDEDPTLLPKSKRHAKFADVTLPENQDTDLGDTDGHMDVSNNQTSMEFQRTAYFTMRLDNIDELGENFMEADLTQHHHQAAAADITLFDTFDAHQTETGPFDRFERFDTELEEETHFNIPQYQTEIPTTLIPSPPSKELGPKDNEVHRQNPSDKKNSGYAKQRSESDAAQQVQRRRRRRAPAFLIDNEQIISGNIYQSWLRSSADLVSKKGKDKKLWGISALSKMKIAHLMDLPPVVLSCGLIAKSTGDIYYPAPLLELWMKSSQAPQHSPSARTSAPRAPEASSSSPPPGVQNHFPSDFVFPSIELQRATEDHTYVPDIGLVQNGLGANENNQKTPSSLSAAEARSMSTPSLGSGPGLISNNTDGSSVNKKRPHATSRNNVGFLEPLDEDCQWGQDLTLVEEQREPKFKMAKWSHDKLFLDEELLVETGPTQTQRHPVVDEDTDNRTNVIRRHLKSYFETPGVPQAESLNQIADGMNKQRAAQLFYQICTLATRDCLEVEQPVPYGDIRISRGPKL